MKHEEFDELVTNRLSIAQDTLFTKSIEYCSETDKLHNFKRAAAMEQCTPERALVGMVSKQIVSLLDMVDATDKGKIYPMALWTEKTTDTINYLILLEALVVERNRIPVETAPTKKTRTR